jgi:thiopeptide-type bacteriocin biosynthesis protein
MTHFIPADFFVLRTPSLSWDVVRDWSEGLEAAAACSGGGDLSAALARDEDTLRERIREIVRRPFVRAALGAASPSLSARLDPWLTGGRRDETCTVEPAVVRYVMRMAGRATPFGLFAGCSVGAAGPRTQLFVPSADSYVRHTRLNLDWVFAVAVSLSRNEEWRPYLLYRTNTTLYRVGGRIRFYSVRIDASKKRRNARTYPLCDLASNPYAETAIAVGLRQEGATMDDIARAIVDACDDMTYEAAFDYVKTLVDAQLLWSPLLPPVTGEDAARGLAAKLCDVPGASATAEALQSLLNDVQELDAAPPCEILTREAAILEKARALAEEVDVSNLLRTDLRKPTSDVTLSPALLRDITAAVELAASVTVDEEGPIAVFTRLFAERYQQREVPLLEALDAESGVGFEAVPGGDPSPLTKGLDFSSSVVANVSWGAREELLLETVSSALRTGTIVVELSKDDVAVLASGRRKPRPVGTCAIVTLAAKSAERLERGEFQVLVSGGGHTTSAALLGRFIHDTPELDAPARAALRTEESHDHDAIHAEIAHNIEGLATNMSCRPILRAYEIDVAGGSGAPVGRRLAVDDLLVSVRDGELVLRSRAHGRRVVPHLSSAHAYKYHGLAVYRFLASLQKQSVGLNTSWSWGALAKCSFLPRVTHGKVVLSLATWRLSADRVSALRALRDGARFRAIQDLRTELRIPRHVSLVDSDNLLPVDLENVLSIESLLDACKPASAAVLSERFHEGAALVARGPEGAFCHELLVPLLRAPAPSVVAPRLSVVSRLGPTASRAQRPGSEWLYAKAYCGTVTSDRVLVDVVTPLVTALRSEGLIDRWFFIRYCDPDLHLRLRFHGDPNILWTDVAPRLFTAMATMGDLVHKTVLDTYDPEVERYGGPDAMDVAYRVFEADSDAALRIVDAYRTDANARWRVALLGMDALLDDLGLCLEEKCAIVASARDDWARALGTRIELTRQLGEKFRGMRAEMEGLLDSAPVALSAGARALQSRSVAFRAAGTKLRELEGRRDLACSRSQIAGSYLHMWANRIFRGSPNRHELVLYDILHRLYKSAIARARCESVSRRVVTVAHGSRG